MKDLSLVVLVRERTKHIPQLLEYYKSWTCKKYIFDSSVKATKIRSLRGFEYFHFGPMHIFDKWPRILSDHINTEFVLDCADDDVSILSTTQECLTFLRKNPDFVLASGAIAEFDPSSATIWAKNPGTYQASIDCNFSSANPTERLHFLLGKCPDAPNHTVLRSSVLKGFYHLVRDTPQWNAPSFFERMFIPYAAIRGNSKTIPGLFQIRDASNKASSLSNFLKWPAKELGPDNINDEILKPLIQNFPNEFPDLQQGVDTLKSVFKHFFENKSHQAQSSFPRCALDEALAKSLPKGNLFFGDLLEKHSSEIDHFKKIYFQRKFPQNRLARFKCIENLLGID